jgi:hypothetical protein
MLLETEDGHIQIFLFSRVAEGVFFSQGTPRAHIIITLITRRS